MFAKCIVCQEVKTREESVAMNGEVCLCGNCEKSITIRSEEMARKQRKG